MDFFNGIFYNLALLEFYFLTIIYILLYIDFILSIFFQHSNMLTRASHHWCLASNIVLVYDGATTQRAHGVMITIVVLTEAPLTYWNEWVISSHTLKDRAHLSAFKFFILEKFSCFIVLVVFFVIFQSSELIYVWFREKMTFFLKSPKTKSKIRRLV